MLRISDNYAMNSVLIAIMVLQVCLVIFIMVVLYVVKAFRKDIEHRVDSYEHTIRDFVNPKDDKTPSELALIAQNYAKLTAGELMASMSAKAMQENSLMAKDLKKIEAAAAEDQLNEANPAIAAVMSLSPNLKKLALGNTRLLGLISQMFSRTKAPGDNGHSATTASNRLWNMQ